MRNERLDAALFYEDCGLAVVPCHEVQDGGTCSCGNPTCTSEGKHPRVEWKDLEKADPEQIREWWARWPDANVGILTGCRSNVTVADYDVTKHPEAAEEWIRLGDVEKCSWLARTGSGGFHLYGSGNGLGSSQGLIARGLDIRGEPGLIIAPPSRNKRGAYTWLNNPANTPLRPFPAELARRIMEAEAARAKQERAGTADPGGPIPEGQRNTALFKLACRLRHDALSEGAILAALRVVNAERCKPPLPDGDLAKIAESAAKYDPTQDPAAGPSASEARGFETLDLANLEDVEPPKFLIPNLLYDGQFAILGGDPKSGKTMLAISAALSVATGATLFGVKPARTGPVAFVELDVSRELFIYFVRELAVGLGVDTSAPWSPIELYLAGGIDLKDRGCREWFHERIAEIRPALCVFDALYRCSSAEENSAKELADVLAFFSDLRTKTGAAILLVDHLRKPVEGESVGPYLLRGSGSKYGAADSVLLCRARKGSSSVIATHRAGPSTPPLKFTIEGDTAGALRLVPTDGAAEFDPRAHDTVEARERARQVREVKVLSWLKDNPGWHSQREILTGAHVSSRKILETLEDLLEKHQAEDNAQWGKDRRWRLSATPS